MPRDGLLYPTPGFRPVGTASSFRKSYQLGRTKIVRLTERLGVSGVTKVSPRADQPSDQSGSGLTTDGHTGKSIACQLLRITPNTRSRSHSAVIRV